MARTKGLQRLVNRRGVMGKIVVDANAVRFAKEILSTPNALEGGKMGACVVQIDPEAFHAGCQGGDCIAEVVPPRYADAEASAGHAADEKIERLECRPP